ncbi:MAG: hypothetical protein IPJ17_16435 [Holophagales bacterium]|nr:MAG: hypothetical protein IPJ17_16435 [Holophagales bacterium]
MSRRSFGWIARLALVALVDLSAFAATSPAAERKVGLQIGVEPAPLASTFTPAAFAGWPAKDSGDPLAAAPAGVRITFDGATLAAELLPAEAQLLILPVPSYKKLLDGEARDGLKNHLEHLENLLAGSGRVSGYLEPVPRPAARLRFRARVEMLDFRGGRAMRFVGGYARTAKMPAQLAYTAQGLTKDGLFLVTLFWPVTARGFTPAAEPGESGVALDALPADAFEPPLATLDGLVGSLRVAR